MLKELLAYLPALHSYPDWIKLLVLAWVVLTVSLAVVLFVFCPGFELKVDEMRVGRASGDGVITFQFSARNPLDGVAQLVELQLSFFGKTKPKGGLQSFQQTSATYILGSGSEADNLIVGVRGDAMRYEIAIVYPYAGQEYAEVKIPLSQVIKKDETDRFVVRLNTKDLPKDSHRKVEAVIRYNGDRLTAPKTVSLPPRPT
jgi:hypothetical protein